MKHPFRTWLLTVLLLPAVAGAQHVLEPLDTSSPRSTLAQFLAAVDKVGEAGSVYRSSPSRENFLKLARAFQPPRRCFDLSQIPETARRESSGEAIVLLWEVLSRTGLPPFDEVPDRAAMKARVTNGEPDSWTIPHTEITLVRVKEGERAGEYLFSAATVERLPEFYRRVATQPYVREMTINNPRRLHKHWAGWMIPPRVTDALPGWLVAEVGDQVLWKWLVVMFLLALLLYVTWKVHRWAGGGMREHRLGQYLRPLAAPTAFLALMPAVEYLVRVQVGITGTATDLVQALFPALTYLATAWLVWQGALFVAEAPLPGPCPPLYKP